MFLTILLQILNTRHILKYADSAFGIFLFSTVFFTSIICTHLHDNRFEKTINQNTEIVYGSLSSDLTEKNKSYMAELNLIIDLDNEKIHKTNAIVYFQKDSLSSELRQGDVISVRNNFKQPTESFGEAGFNYRKYLATQNIFFTSYQSSADWKYINSLALPLHTRLLNKLRSHLQTQLDIYITCDKERAIASALLLGNKVLLDKETKQTYSQTGAMHILAVSGLHVGILYTFLALILARFKRNRLGHILTVIFELSIIWIFAAITEFSPSVTRAAVMFSFIAVGRSLSRYTSIYNILCISALLLLLYKPSFIYEIGFQLSYAAVFSIIFLYKYIYRLFVIKNKVLDFFWSILAVSIAAQIGTAPLTMFYFGQFPTYFFISNLFAIPAATGILWLGFLLFISAALQNFIDLSFIQYGLGRLLEGIIYFLNYCLEWVQSIPGSVIYTLDFHLANAISLYLVVLAFMYFLYNTALKMHRLRVLMAAILIYIIVVGADQVLSASMIESTLNMIS